MFDFGIVSVRDAGFFVALVGIVVNGTLWWVKRVSTLNAVVAYVLDNSGRPLKRIW